MSSKPVIVLNNALRGMVVPHYLFHWDITGDEMHVELFYMKNRVRRFVTFVVPVDTDDDEMVLFLADELKRNSAVYKKDT